MLGAKGGAHALIDLGGSDGFSDLAISESRGAAWDQADYKPVPAVIDAAISLFAGHGVRDIALASAQNLEETAEHVFSIIQTSQQQSHHAVIFLTGVPGAGKTLAGLNIVHGAVQRQLSAQGDIVYLSGNTPLVVVLREALAKDQYEQRKKNLADLITLNEARRRTRATIQHVNDFLKHYVTHSTAVPSGHVIVFDEAQRAWDAKQGNEKFQRDASEPYLVLEAMARHTDWSVTVCLVGLGQEINNGEEGLGGWADAITKLSAAQPMRWKVYAPTIAYSPIASSQSLGLMSTHVSALKADALHLDVPMRSFRSPLLGDWIEAVLSGNPVRAMSISQKMTYPLATTRDLTTARAWLSVKAQGERRKGLLASSGARRLRADGLGESLNATDGQAIAHWYLQPPGDIRSSHAMEVPANEYTSQGLELDFACLCWGGDLVWEGKSFMPRRLNGNRWANVKDDKNYVKNSYRVLLSRAREGLILWVPRGDKNDHTRQPEQLDRIATYLTMCGAVSADVAP